MTFPAECDSNPMTPQEAILEFMLFDLDGLRAAVHAALHALDLHRRRASSAAPRATAAATSSSAARAPRGSTAAAADPGKCGMMNNCMPSTCAAQSIQCGQAGDGCGNVLELRELPDGPGLRARRAGEVRVDELVTMGGRHDGGSEGPPKPPDRSPKLR